MPAFAMMWSRRPWVEMADSKRETSESQEVTSHWVNVVFGIWDGGCVMSAFMTVAPREEKRVQVASPMPDEPP